jgi:hypothetical protein
VNRPKSTVQNFHEAAVRRAGLVAFALCRGVPSIWHKNITPGIMQLKPMHLKTIVLPLRAIIMLLRMLYATALPGVKLELRATVAVDKETKDLYAPMH